MIITKRATFEILFSSPGEKKVGLGSLYGLERDAQTWIPDSHPEMLGTLASSYCNEA